MAKNTTIHRIQIEGTSDLIKLRKELDGYQQALKKVKKETKDGMTSGQAKKYQELSSSIKSTRKELNQTEKSLKGMNTSSKKGIGFIGKMAGAFTVATLAAGAFQKISRAVSQAIIGGVETFKKYEFAMSKVKAISGATEAEFKALDKSAQDLGRTTFFTAEEVANLQINFSKLGFTAKETLAAQEAALNTATATGEDLARTATVIGSTLRGFGLDASEAGRVSDVMAASFTGSALTLEKFQTAMTKVAPVAKILGMSLEDTTATLGVLTDSGIEASIAGTSLRNIFLKLGDPSSDLAKSIGFTVNSGEDMVVQFKRMAKEGVDVEKMLEIVDVRQVAAISTMIENIDVLERQIGAYENSAGAAKDMADIVGDNLEGAMLRFKSAMQGLAIVLTERIAPIITSVTEGFTKFVSLITQAADTKLSEELEQDRIALIGYESRLSDANLSQANRVKIIKELKSQYPDYLKNIDAEKVSNNQLKKSLQGVNDMLVNKILLQQEDEKILEAVQDEADAVNEKRDKAKDLEEDIARLSDKHNLSLKEGLSLQEQAEDLGERIMQKRRDARIGGGDQEVNRMLLNMRQLNIAEQEMLELANETSLLQEQKLALMKELNIELDKQDDTTTTTNLPTGGSPANTDADPVGDALKSGEFDLQESLLSIKQMFGDKEIETKADLNARLQEMQLIHLESMLEIEGLSAEQRMALEQRVADVKVKNRNNELDAADKLKEKEVDRIEQMKETGELLMKIGEAEGENSRIKAVGIKISQAAAVASGIQGLIDSSGGIAAQAKLPFPSNLIAMAATAAQVASVVSGIKALMGDSDKFEQGGLTNGGMFKGASHANGGVKFAVGGRIHEAEGGEAIINKRSTAMFKPMLSAMNQAGGGVKFANGGFLSTGEKFAMGGEVADVQQMISGAGGSTQVVMVESDVTRTQGRVSNIESQATF
jgi:TP901 family phage tail tape measure protein|tara:strand:- start:802 stop:3624 length:2823 start_codon:yes stop_codon:yes gene_type:complete